MTMNELEEAALKLDSSARARLAERLLARLEDLSDEENARIWAEEAQRRDADLDAHPDRSRDAGEVMKDARSRLG